MVLLNIKPHFFGKVKEKMNIIIKKVINCCFLWYFLECYGKMGSIKSQKRREGDQKRRIFFLPKAQN